MMDLSDILEAYQADRRADGLPRLIADPARLVARDIRSTEDGAPVTVRRPRRIVPTGGEHEDRLQADGVLDVVESFEAAGQHLQSMTSTQKAVK